MVQFGGFYRSSRRRVQAADAWSRGGYAILLQPDPSWQRMRLFAHYAAMLGEHATPQLSHSPSLQPAAPVYPVLVYSRQDTGPGDGTKAG